MPAEGTARLAPFRDKGTLAMTTEQDPIDVTEPLIELLRNFDFAFRQEPDSRLTLENEQQRYAAACAAVCRFLSKIDPTHADRFFDLSVAFGDLTMGSRPLIFKPLKLKAVPNPTQIETAKASVAFALDALIELGEQPKQAARTLLAKFPAIKNLAGPKSHRSGNTWEDTILGWRKTLSAPKRAKNELAAEIFTAGRALTAAWLSRDDQRAELKRRAMGRVKRAAQIGVFVARSNPR
jgi:hypothetical protein